MGATVVGHHRLRHDIAVMRLIGDYVPFVAGQSVEVRIPQHPGLQRRLSPALAPSRDGKLEFHVRTVPGGWCSGTIVADTQPGDEWRITDPAGWLSVDNDATDVVMLAGGTGLAPLRSILLEISRRPEPPRTHLFIGGRSPRDLYASDMLYLLTGELPWLTVVPVVESPDDPDLGRPVVRRPAAWMWASMWTRCWRALWRTSSARWARSNTTRSWSAAHPA